MERVAQAADETRQSAVRLGVPVKRAGRGIPWHLWVGMLAVLSAYVGGEWDVSWHRSIGRDTFWTPAHMALYSCAVLGAVVGLWLVVRTTAGWDVELRAASVRFYGLRGPLGVFLMGWGGVAMLTSAPFDNWWHNAYGLDVRLVSPPHVLLILGLRAIAVGVFLLLLAEMNRAMEGGEARYAALRRMFLFLGGLAVGSQMYFVQEYTLDTMLQRASAYIVVGLAVPVVMGAIWETAGFRWSSTLIAGLYMSFVIVEILVLPLFPATPRLGPAFYPVTHMVPAKFPLLLVAPAVVLDLLWQRSRRWKLWQASVVSGVVFVAVLMAVEWPFAKFLMSTASQNRFFGTMYYGFPARADGFERMRRLFYPEHGGRLAVGMMKAMVCASVSAGTGLALGRWMRGVRR
jgi:hypothetical protein